MFKSDSDCYDNLKRLRWPEGFVCPRCGSCESWSMGNGRVLCAKGRRQQSVLSNTVMHRTHLPIKMWFRVMWCICASKSGAGALSLKHALGIGSYNTAWLCLHKLRRAMVRPGREVLSGVVEADETYVGAPREGKTGRGAHGKRLVFGFRHGGGEGSRTPVRNGVSQTSTRVGCLWSRMRYADNRAYPHPPSWFGTLQRARGSPCSVACSIKPRRSADIGASTSRPLFRRRERNRCSQLQFLPVF